MSKQVLLTVLFTWVIFATAFAQTSRLEGRVSDAQNRPVVGFSLQLKGTRYGTVTDSDGAFRLTDLPAGEYRLLGSGVGFRRFDQAVQLTDGQTTTLALTATEQMEELQTVEITGRRETDYKTDLSFVATKTATALKDIPQSVSYITKELLQDQAIFRLNEAVKNFSGVNQFSFYNDLTIRGHRVSGGDNYASLVNGLRSNSSFWKQNLTPHLERVEVIKGPASALFGNTSPGGTINRVTKKPLDEARQSLSFSVGSFNTFRSLADFTGPMNEQKTLLYRLNLGYENAMSFRDLQYDKNLIVAPSVTFLPSDRTRLNFDVVYQNSNGRLDRGQAVLGNGDLYSVPISRSLNRTNDYLKEETYNITLSLNHRFNEHISFNSAYMKTGYEEDLLEHRSANTYAKDGAGQNIPNLVEMQVFIRQRRWFDDNISNYFNLDFATGKLAHRLVIGYDYAQQKLAPGGSQLVARGYRNAANTGAINTFNPARAKDYLLDSQGAPVPNVAHFNLTEANPYYMADMSKYFYSRTDYPPTFYYTQGFYAQNQMSIGKLKVLAGFRQDYFTEVVEYKTAKERKVKQQALIPRLGLVYSLTPNINAYATYVKGYQPQVATTIANPNAGGPFDPLVSRLVEGGFKSEWFDKRLNVTASVYNLELNGTLYPANQPNQPDLLTQVGQEVAKGVELDVIGQIATNWNVVLNYAYNDATITRSTTESQIGQQKPNAPKHQGNFWTKYVVSSGPLQGIGIGVGGNFVGKRLTSLNTAQSTPAYEVFNAALYYQMKKFQIQVNVNNLADKTYWVGGYDYIRLFPGAPRNFLATVGYTF